VFDRRHQLVQIPLRHFPPWPGQLRYDKAYVYWGARHYCRPSARIWSLGVPSRHMTPVAVFSIL
jgi:hypothetical protein